MTPEAPTTPVLRPRGLFELIDAAFTVCAEEPAVVGLGLLGMAPVALVSIVLWYGATEAVFDEPTELAVAFLAALAALWRHVPGGAVALLITERVGGRPLQSLAALREALRRAPSLMAAGSLAFWVTLLSAGLAGLPLLGWSAVYLALPLTIRRDCPPWGVLRAGRALLRSRRMGPAMLTGLWAAGVCLLALNLWLGVALALSLGSSLFDLDTALLGRLLSPSNPIFLPAIGAIALTLLEPLRQASLALLYLDARVRRDALDLEAQVGHLENEGRAPAGRRHGPAQRSQVATLLLLVMGVGALASSGAAPGLARADELLASQTPADAFIDVANEAIDRGVEVDSDEASRVLTALTPRDEAALQPLTEALRADLEADEIDRAEARLQQAFSEMGVLADREPAAEPEAKALLVVVMARPEFQRESRTKLVEAATDEEKSSTWFTRLMDRLARWLEDLFRSDSKERAEVERDSPLLPPELSWLLWAALLAVATAGIAVAVLRALGNLEEDLLEDERTLAPEVPDEDAPGGPRFDALAQAPDAWLARADALARRGELREALRAAYLALLGILDHLGTIAYRSEHTNWDHVRAFEGPEAARAAFHRLTLRFERTWYGFDPVATADYRDVREGALDLATLVRDPVVDEHGERSPAPEGEATT